MTDKTELIETVARAFDVPVDLLTESRKHDLPPKWNGLAVRWGEWKKAPYVFICPSPDDLGACPKCGSIALREVNVGEVAALPEITVEQIEQREARRAELPAHARGDLARLAWRRLHVSRCGDCLHDVVVDMDTHETWDLDYTDYGDEGSVEPDPTPAPAPKKPAKPKASSGRAAFAAARAELQAKKNQETLL